MKKGKEDLTVKRAPARLHLQQTLTPPEHARTRTPDFDQTTKINFQEIAKVTAASERSRGAIKADQWEPFVDTALNPSFIPLHFFIEFMRLVALYHFVMVPVRISFLPFASYTSSAALSTDLGVGA